MTQQTTYACDTCGAKHEKKSEIVGHISISNGTDIFYFDVDPACAAKALQAVSDIFPRRHMSEYLQEKVESAVTVK